MSVAEVILQQLGGGRFIAMTGARGLVGASKALQFNLPRFSGVKVNHVQIVLEPSDTYRVTFYRVSRTSVKVLAEVGDVYCDQLRDVFERHTGLATSLGTMGQKVGA